MGSTTVSPRFSAWLALLCAFAVTLAGAAPLLVDVLEGPVEDWPINPSQDVTDRTDSHTHTSGMPNEVLILVSIGCIILQPLMFSLQSAHPTVWAWSPLPLIHPPTVLYSI